MATYEDSNGLFSSGYDFHGSLPFLSNSFFFSQDPLTTDPDDVTCEMDSTSFLNSPVHYHSHQVNPCFSSIPLNFLPPVLKGRPLLAVHLSVMHLWKPIPVLISFIKEDWIVTEVRQEYLSPQVVYSINRSNLILSESYSSSICLYQ